MTLDATAAGPTPTAFAPTLYRTRPTAPGAWEKTSMGTKALRTFLALAVAAVGLAGPAAAQEIDSRCYINFPTFADAMVRSQVGEVLGGCKLTCTSRLEVVVNGEVTGSSEFPHYLDVDDCDTTAVFRFSPDYMPDARPASTALRAILEDFEAEAYSAVIALQQLPFSDDKRNSHVSAWGRGALRAWLGARVFEIAAKLEAERSPVEQAIAERYEEDIRRMRVNAVEFAISEYERWEDNPCTYTAPEGFSYTGAAPYCSGGSLINIFDTPSPPTKEEFLAYGAVEVRRKLTETGALLASAEASRFSQFLTGLSTFGVGGLLVGGLISAGLAAAIITNALFLFPYAGPAIVNGAVSLAVGAGPTAVAASAALGVVAIVVLAVFVAALQGFFVFTEAAIPVDLQAALAEAQMQPVLSELVDTDLGRQELSDVFLLSTLPDFPGSTDPLPVADQNFGVTPAAGGAENVVTTLEYVGRFGDPWQTQLARGWFKPRPMDGSDYSILSLLIEYRGCDGDDWNADRIGNQFLLYRNEGDATSASDAMVSDRFCFRGTDGNNWYARIIADPTPPQIDADVTGTLGSNGWYISDVDISWEVTDADSSILWEAGCSDRTVTSNGSKSFTCRAESQGGRAADTVAFKRDATPPSITPSVVGLNAAGWSNSSVEVSFACSDAHSGVDFCTATTVYSTEMKNQAPRGTARDRAGNTNEAYGVPISIDRTAPTVEAEVAPAANANGWNNTDVTVQCTCVDYLSGIDTCTPASTALTIESPSQSVLCEGSDVAGNTGSAPSGEIRIDRTGPVVTVATPPAAAAPDALPAYILGEAVAADWQALDGLSGLGPVVATAASGQALDTATIGVKTFTVTATDRAGNTTTVERSYEVLDPVATFDFAVDTVTMSTWLAGQRDNGFLRVRGRLADPTADGSFLERIFEGGFEVTVRDGDGSFDVAVSLEDCRLRRGRPNGLVCVQRRPRRLRISLAPVNPREMPPSEYALQVMARDLPDSETGALVRGENNMEGPVSVSVRRGGATTSDELADCVQRGSVLLSCGGTD